jgi:hypothetical protein
LRTISIIAGCFLAFIIRQFVGSAFQITYEKMRIKILCELWIAVPHYPLCNLRTDTCPGKPCAASVSSHSVCIEVVYFKEVMAMSKNFTPKY